MFRNRYYRYRASKNIVSTGLDDRSSATAHNASKYLEQY